MAADRPSKKEKKDKKEKKRSAEEGVKKDKKDRKDKKEKKAKLAAALDEHLQAEAAASALASGVMAVDVDEETTTAVVVAEKIAPLSMVPFAVPLADEKSMKKVLKTVRKAAKNNALKRGVKEVVKTLRKSPASSPTNRAFPGIVIIAGDISPMDVISHIPVLCEDHNVPYIFVPSRAELGAAAKTKRPTSVVMIMENPETRKKAAAAAAKKDEKDEGEDDGEKYSDTYQSLVKLVQKETERQSFW
ncbi:putative H/ACA ribonucleoprotein complex subunit [Scedosporium apiospermum]|uniref:H/ACA ribonucleoprotein complex subunit 2 n=1 Tax=Pseudallescheria apiosperma TaxID=563466 RepID=A0A084FUH7_PSEDA|nr:putative H/ACA ribonucleoprotein complex subunit [Scedosporium apiospermum]KEZ38739.1 putative H/ACA ribonucleoprotein complex subunit [Scedosporium apiospermum]